MGNFVHHHWGCKSLSYPFRSLFALSFRSDPRDFCSQKLVVFTISYSTLNFSPLVISKPNDEIVKLESQFLLCQKYFFCIVNYDETINMTLNPIYDGRFLQNNTNIYNALQNITS